MDRYAFMALIPITAIFFTGLIAFSFTRLGRAIASRMEGRLDESTERRLAALEAANEELHRALVEAHERLDFAERALIRRPADRVDTPA
jgi:hypothetical protein